MNTLLRLIVVLVAAASPLALIAAEKTPPATAAPIEVGPDVRCAWDALQAADAKIGELIAQNRLPDVPAQARLVKVSVETIVRGIRTTDELILKRLISAGREILTLADRLAVVASAGNRARAEVIHDNLHNYVDFVRKRLPAHDTSQSSVSLPL